MNLEEYLKELDIFVITDIKATRRITADTI